MLHIGPAEVEVLDAALTAAQYRTQTDIGEHGEITRIVSLDLQRMVEFDYDRVVDYIAEQVVGELGEEWQLHSYRLVCVDPRQDDTSEEGTFGLFEVTVDPDQLDPDPAQSPGV